VFGEIFLNKETFKNDAFRREGGKKGHTGILKNEENQSWHLKPLNVKISVVKIGKYF
jgi:hypothetical protein